LRYDQFMGLGWKLLIPVSLAWIMIVSTARALRNQGYGQLTTALMTVGAVAALIILFALWRSMRARTVRNIPEQAVDTGAFPVPPLPTASKESTHA
jgi:NADH-quinone oxidoreductase subunit H